MGQTYSKTPSSDLCRYIQSIVCRSRKTSVYYLLFLKCPPCAIVETEGVNLVGIDTLVSELILYVKHYVGLFILLF